MGIAWEFFFFCIYNFFLTIKKTEKDILKGTTGVARLRGSARSK
jgi:hypothetical protein